MAAAPTTYLQIVRVADEYTAQPIPTINTAMVDIDATIAGMLILSVAGSSNVTLTRAQGLNRVFQFTGILTGNINILFPAALGCARDFLVWNATTGAFTLTVKTTTGGSAGVAVTTAKKVYCFHDGTNVYKATAEV